MHTLTCIGSSVVPDLRQSKWASQLWVGVRGPLVLLWDIQYIGNCTTPLGKETRNFLDNKRGLFWVRMLCTWQLHSLRGWCPPPPNIDETMNVCTWIFAKVKMLCITITPPTSLALVQRQWSIDVHTILLRSSNGYAMLLWVFYLLCIQKRNTKYSPHRFITHILYQQGCHSKNTTATTAGAEGILNIK